MSAGGRVKEWEQFQRTRTGRSFDSLTFDIEPDMPPVTITIEKGVTITGHVFDPDGKPVQGATVAPARTGSGNSITGDNGQLQRRHEGRRFVHDAAAVHVRRTVQSYRARWAVWQNGPYWGNGVGEPFDSKPGDKIEDVKAHANQQCNREGSCHRHRWQSRRRQGSASYLTDGLDNRYYVASTRTDKDGSYELKLIRPTEMMIQAEPFWLRPGETTGKSTQTVTLGEKEVKEGVDLVSKGQ